MSFKHSSNNLGHYLNIHSTVLEQYRRMGFVLSEDLEIEYGVSKLFMSGSIYCESGLRIQVNKTIDILESDGMKSKVKTSHFSYSAIVAGDDYIFRYDSPHPDHRNYPHVHRKSDDGCTVGIGELYSEEEIPTLGEVIGELYDFYTDNVLSGSS